MEDHEIGGHLSRDLNLLGLQLSVHAEQHVVGVTVVPCRSDKSPENTGGQEKHRKNYSSMWCVVVFGHRVCVNMFVPAHCSSLAMMMAVRAASLYCCSAM